MNMEADRRIFLQQSAAGVCGAAALLATPQRAQGKTADELTLGIIGCGGRGNQVGKFFAAQEGVRIGYVCDPDAARLAATAQTFSVPQSHAVSDLRRMLEDPSVDAVLIATPNHWHTPAAIMACQAGKHVYVEKPCSHNLREGRLLVEVAQSTGRLVQHGTQIRSTAMMAQAVQAMRQGCIGEVLSAKVWNVQRRGSIGRAEPTEPPAGFDYDTWIGPAPFVPFRANCHHGTYNWFYNFGSGDIGNDGIHDLDYGRWGLGVETHPSQIAALGGKFFFDDDQEFPDTQQVTYLYPADDSHSRPRLLIYEQRLWSTNYPRNCDSGAEFYGTDGQLFMSRRGKLQVLDARNQRVDLNIAEVPQDDVSHVANFVRAIRQGEPLNAPIDVGHLTASLCHLGNVATRLGRTIQFDPATEQCPEDAEANALLRRTYRDHWATPNDV